MTRQGSALIVDDFPEVRTLISLALEGLGLEIEEAGDGQAAILKIVGKVLFCDHQR